MVGSIPYGDYRHWEPDCIYSVHEDTLAVSTTFEMMMTVNNVNTLISTKSVTCSNEFTVQTDADVSDTASLSSQLSATLATFKLLDIGEWSWCIMENSRIFIE